MLNDIYNARILELAGNISRCERLPEPDASATGHSKLCGSKVSVDIDYRNGVVVDYGQEVKACMLGQAASAIMAQHVVGCSAAQLRRLRDQVYAMIKNDGPPPTGKWSDIAALQPVKDYKARHASTMLVFDAVVEALDKIPAQSEDAGEAQ